MLPSSRRWYEPNKKLGPQSLEHKMSSNEVQKTNALAHPGKRFQEQFIDGLVTYFIGYLSFYIMGFFISKEAAGYFGITIGVTYFLLSDSLPNGQSIGKRLLNIQVVSKQTMRPCSFLQSFFRNVTCILGIFDWASIFFGLHRRLGDFIASTIVVKKTV
jgi:uncharacterized RDD family membrane protein YckC